MYKRMQLFLFTAARDERIRTKTLHTADVKIAGFGTFPADLKNIREANTFAIAKHILFQQLQVFTRFCSVQHSCLWAASRSDRNRYKCLFEHLKCCLLCEI